ncbi:MAG: DUF362 domain-containing protein [Acidobacteria bacterium]|nr:DUF362 domain-containing protein [Acidobacteriota bacterium]
MMKRRDFIKSGIIAGAGLAVGPSILTSAGKPDLAVVKGDDPSAITRKAIEMLGGMKNFISKDDVVIVKPNIGWDRVPELAGNTNPDVVKAIVQMALEAGAKTVKVMDNTCNDARRCYIRSGIQEAAKAAGAEVKFMDERRFKDVKVGGGVLKNWPVYSEILDADKIINVPIVKHHGLSKVTLGMKNWFGAVGGNRSMLHQDINNAMVDMSNFFKPALTIIDAYRVRFRNGPQGTNPNDVRLEKTVVAGIDPLKADAFSATIMNHKPQELQFLRIASGGDREKLNIEKYNIVRATI